LVITVYNWARPRDLSHFERFEHYHATLYQQVEALSVTPFSPRAIDRGLSALMVSIIRLYGVDFNLNEKAEDLYRDHPYVKTALEQISIRAGLVTGRSEVEQMVREEIDKRLDFWLARAKKYKQGGSNLGYEKKKDGRTLGLLERPGSVGGWDLFSCLTSLRDVEPAVNLILNNYELDMPSTDGNKGVEANV
jgi:hypothetical protein